MAVDISINNNSRGGITMFVVSETAKNLFKEYIFNMLGYHVSDEEIKVGMDFNRDYLNALLMWAFSHNFKIDSELQFEIKK